MSDALRDVYAILTRRLAEPENTDDTGSLVRAATICEEALRSGDGWTRVGDGLPKVEGEYQVYVFAKHGSRKGNPLQWVAMWNGIVWLEFDPLADEYCQGCCPTHWRPLPPAPEDRE